MLEGIVVETRWIYSGKERWMYPSWRWASASRGATVDSSIAALASGEIEVLLLLLVPWAGESPPPTCSAHVYVEDRTRLCTAYQHADIVETVAA